MQTTKISSNPVGEDGRGDIYANYNSDLSGPIYLRQKTDEGDSTVVIPSLKDLTEFIDYIIDERLREALINKIEDADSKTLRKIDTCISQTEREN